jgi:hypothetical protein
MKKKQFIKKFNYLRQKKQTYTFQLNTTEVRFVFDFLLWFVQSLIVIKRFVIKFGYPLHSVQTS